jgi:chemotaxis methyl-accepting protein methylase
VEDSLLELLKYIETNTAFKCQNYKEKPLIRRLRVRMRALDLQNFSDYHQYLRKNPGEFKKLLDVLTINLSYFFRNPETFDYLRLEVFPRFKTRPKLIFWSAGCAYGEEAYSMAILAAEAGFLDRTVVYGTDIDRDAIQKADAGVYSPLSLQYATDDIKARYFRVENAVYVVDKNLKYSVRFINQDLFYRPEFEICDLIMCRNVLIYLDRKAQSTVLNNLYNQLKVDGYLAIGKVELLLGVPEVKLFQLVNRAEHIYQKA